MAAESLSLGDGIRRAFSLRHPVLPEEQVLVARLLAVAWIATGHVAQPTPIRVPWWRLLESVPDAFPWSPLMAGLGLLAAFGILFTPWTRRFCLGLGALILLDLAASRAAFSYNRLYCAALFGMIALSGPGTLWAPRVQAALVYLGAGVDKLLSSGWRSGELLDGFIHHLAGFGRLWSPGGHVGEPNAVARALAMALDRSSALPAVLSWSVIFCELGIAALLLRRSRYAGGLLLAFHGGVFVVTGGTLGMFFHAGLISALLAVPFSTGRTLLGSPSGLFCLCLWSCGPWLGPAFFLVLLGIVLVARLPSPPDGAELDAQRIQA